MKFEACGPFRLPRIKRKLIDSTAAARREFWAEVEEEYPGLSEACGCYEKFGVRVKTLASRFWPKGGFN